MNNKKLICVLLLCIPTVALFPISNVSFWNLGFSSDYRYVCFGQYWIEERELYANGEIGIIDISRNNFVNDGQIYQRSSFPISIGSDGRNIILDLIRNNSAILNRYAIEHTNKGRIIYVRVANGIRSNEIEFQDFQSKNRYFIQLITKKNNTGAAFHLQGVITRANGTQQSFSVGLPDYYRPNVRNYTISQIIVAPNNRSYVFVIEQTIGQTNGKTPPIRYMVETLSIDQ